ncbi:MAG TPA: low temperature requirement protein A [Gaiellaceae bacterium]|nr:low temperature requirement protein A [Gaiellaceae bacterium]
MPHRARSPPNAAVLPPRKLACRSAADRVRPQPDHAARVRRDPRGVRSRPLGESIIVTGAGFGELPVAPETTVAFVVAFVGPAGPLGLLRLPHPDDRRDHRDRGRHEELIAHPLDPATVETTALILGGPALYLAGNALFNWSIWEYMPWSRIVAIGALAALVPVALVASGLVLAVWATAVVVALAARDRYAARTRRPAHGSS